MPKQSNPGLRGRTSLGKSSLLLVPGLAAVVGILIGMANGVIAANFGVADSNMKMSIGVLDGAKITGYVGSRANVKQGEKGMLLLGVAGGKATDLCLSTVLDVPIAGPVSLNVRAGGGAPADIHSLTANATELVADTGVLKSAELGRDGSTLTQNQLVKGGQGSWGLQAGTLSAKNAQLTAFNAGASELALSGLSITVKPGKHECF